MVDLIAVTASNPDVSESSTEGSETKGLLDGYFDSQLALLWPRLKHVLEANIKSID